MNSTSSSRKRRRSESSKADSRWEGPSPSRMPFHTNRIEIVTPHHTHSVAFLADGKHVMSGGREMKIRQWRVENGTEVGKPMDAGSGICDLAITQDGKLIVCGTQSGQAIVWDTTTHEKVLEVKADNESVNALDVSVDGTEIATGSIGSTFVWSSLTGRQLLGPLKYDINYWLAAVKFSPNGRRIATATWSHESVRIYDISDGGLHADFPIQVHSGHNGSLAWASDSNRLFALSKDGNIHSLDVYTKKTLAKWRIHSDDSPRCIALACNDTIIAASANSSLSFWDTKTHQQIGFTIPHPHDIWSMAISPRWDIATAGGYNITLQNLYDILPSPYRDIVRLHQNVRCWMVENSDLEDTVQSLRAQNSCQKDDITNLEKIVQELRTQLATSNKDKESLSESSNRKIIHLNESGKELRSVLVASEGSVDRFTQTISAMRRADASLPENNSLSIAPKINELELSVQELGNKIATCKFALRVYDKKHEGETLYACGRIYDAAQHILNAMTEDVRHNKLVIDWLEEFTLRCVSRLQEIGDEASSSKKHDESLLAYSTVLSLNLSPPEDVLAGWVTNISDIIVKCCKARTGSLEDKLVNVTQIIERDPSNYKGYKRRHAVLHSLGRYKEAFDAFEMMLSRMENSLDPQVQDMRGSYFDTTPLIRQVVEQTIHDIPRVLINTITGRLCDKEMQAAAFEQAPIFNELRSLMTTRNRLDRARIQKEVEKFYEYVMFSHRWQPPEPSFRMLENTVIYRIPTFRKLVNFCMLVQSRSFRWAWSDTCCVNQSDKGVQQESVVAMFQWYRRAALTIVHLLGVFSESQEPGSLWKSIWNTRGWTYQEYVASRVIQFYTEDWKPYLGLEMFNHKESPIILAEMEQATKFATEALATLQPGLTRVREKLYLASKRQTTRKEDVAYSLFGIFDVALPIIYGEGMRAVGRLLEHILMRSANVTILAWTGISGSNHSYLPLDLTVYDQVIPLHVPQLIESAKIDSVIKALQSSLPDPSLSPRLYEQLYHLPPLSLVAGRLRLSGLVFPLNKLERLEDDSDAFLPVYRAITPALGEVRIETKDNLAGMEGLVLIHPWISPLIDQDFLGITPQFDLAVRALRLVVRLRQPFGALLLASESRVQYKRVATDNFIKVQIRAETSLEKLMDSIRTVDVQ